MLSGNKGERSEVYTFLKLLGDGKIYSCDSDLNKISGSFFLIIKILRDSFSYFCGEKVKIVDSKGIEKAEIDMDKFCTFADFLLNKIRENSDTTFQVQEIENFLNSIYQTKLKAPSADKKDIVVTIQDSIGNIKDLGYSIKSYLGNNSTLLNASHATNFTFEINHLPDNKIDEINSIDSNKKIRDRIIAIKTNGGDITYFNTDSENFLSNLNMIDSNFPNIIANMLLHFFSGEGNTISKLIPLISNDNPSHIQVDKDEFYKAKIKTFLKNITLGMVPNKVWNNQNEVTGGLLIVKEDGEIVCFHIFNRDEFEEYLFKNTKLDTPSSSRHNFGQIYKEGNKTFFKLNLQVRFI